MLSRSEAIKKIFEKHGDEAVYVTNTGFLSRAIYDIYPEKKNILYMQGSMGLSPAIGIGMALNTDKKIVVFVGDGSLLMHLGITHTLRDLNLQNLSVYVLDNGCHESVGGYHCAPLEKEYPGITDIIKISCDGKTDRVGIPCKQNISNIKELLQ
jgi:thiamine pyrophosphate-dependent acetolactate synthase large subunit-like protein